jgi:prefoldin subunit 5
MNVRKYTIESANSNYKKAIRFLDIQIESAKNTIEKIKSGVYQCGQDAIDGIEKEISKLEEKKAGYQSYIDYVNREA